MSGEGSALACSEVGAPDPHRARARRLLADYPEVRALTGHDPASALFISALVALQVSTAIVLANSPWWVIIAIAYTIGAVASLGLWVLIHECSHDLVFRSQAANRWLSLLANLPTLLPAASSFRKYHLLHHRFHGDPKKDGDLPSRLEVRLVGRSAWRKALWLALMPLVQALRPLRIKAVPFLDRWFFANAAAQAAFVTTIALWAGAGAIAYLTLSGLFAMGLHPLGARWVQEHYTICGAQATTSYYGPMNRVLFNAGYHNEHHDLMSIPWSRLPKLKAIAPELYDTINAHQSWSALLIRFLADRRITLDDRIVRGSRA
jgi:sphingolipid delta-4 desaturase